MAEKLHELNIKELKEDKRLISSKIYGGVFMDIGRIAWELKQEEDKFNQLKAHKMNQLWNWIKDNYQIKKRIIPQSIPYYKNGKIYIHICEEYGFYGERLINLGEVEIRDFLKRFAKKRRKNNVVDMS